MIRFAWNQFRTQALVAFGLLAVAAVAFAVTGIQLDHAYGTAVALCQRQGNCADLSSFFPSGGYRRVNKSLDVASLAIPGLIGMFWGAPLIAREFETGTFRLAWTQGVTRTRWLAAKLGVAGLAAITVSELFSLMLNWWASPIHKAGGATPFTSGISSSYISGIAPAGYAAFAFAVGAAAGLLARRTLPAMALALTVSAVVMTAFPVWVRPHLLPSAQATVALSPASINGFTRSLDGGALSVQAQAPHLPGAWVLSSQLITPDGRTASTVPPSAACGPSSPMGSCVAYIESLRLRQQVSYQPASRYWPLQWYETGIYLALALALAAFCLGWIRPGRSAEPSLGRSRPSGPAPALQRSA